MTTLAEALAPKSDQLNADDLIPGPRTIKITDARITKSDRQTRITLNFEGDNGKPFKPCKTMGRAMVMVWGVTDEKQMIGKSITVYRDPEVKFGDQGAVGGIRISHMSHIDRPATVKLTVSQGKKGTFVFQPLTAEVRQIGGGDTFTIDDAREKLRGAFDLGELRTIWSAKAMAPFRDQLGDVLAEMKTALGSEANANEDRGETHTIDADYLILKIGTKTRQQDVLALIESHRDTIAGFDGDDVQRVEAAKDARLSEIKANA